MMNEELDAQRVHEETNDVWASPAPVVAVAAPASAVVAPAAVYASPLAVSVSVPPASPSMRPPPLPSPSNNNNTNPGGAPSPSAKQLPPPLPQQSQQQAFYPDLQENEHYPGAIDNAEIELQDMQSASQDPSDYTQGDVDHQANL